MRHYIKTLIITVATFYAVYTLIPAINVGQDIRNVLFLLGGLWLIAHVVDPIFSLVLLPINFLTFGLVSLILNAGLIFALINFLPDFYILPYNFPGADIDGIILPAIAFSRITTIILIAAVFTIIQKILQIIFE